MTVELIDLVSLRDGEAVFAPVSVSAPTPVALEIVGANGAGKTTLLRTLAGVHSQYHGSFQIERTLYQGHRTGLDELMSVLDNLNWFAKVRGTAIDQEAVQQALLKVGMLQFALSPVGQLSQGQQRRVCMARWLLSPAPVWLLDEPLVALDHNGQQLLAELIDEHCEAGGWVLYSTHVDIPIKGKQRLEIEGLAGRTNSPMAAVGL